MENVLESPPSSSQRSSDIFLRTGSVFPYEGSSAEFSTCSTRTPGIEAPAAPQRRNFKNTKPVIPTSDSAYGALLRVATKFIKIKVAFVRNLPIDAEENDLKQLFEPFGQVEKVVVSKKGSSPVGFVHFTERLDLGRAVKELNETTVQGPSGGPLYKLQEIESADPYEDVVVALPLPVRERLLRILRLGIATRFDDRREARDGAVDSVFRFHYLAIEPHSLMFDATVPSGCTTTTKLGGFQDVLNVVVDSVPRGCGCGRGGVSGMALLRMHLI